MEGVPVLPEKLQINPEGGPYGVILLERRNYDAAAHTRFDGMVVLPAGARYRYIRRLDDDHVLRINSARGQAVVPSGSEDRARYGSWIKENNLSPKIIRDRSGRALLIVYSTSRDRVFWSLERDGGIYLQVRDPFKRENIYIFPARGVHSGKK